MPAPQMTTLPVQMQAQPHQATSVTCCQGIVRTFVVVLPLMLLELQSQSATDTRYVAG